MFPSMLLKVKPLEYFYQRLNLAYNLYNIKIENNKFERRDKEREKLHIWSMQIISNHLFDK